ncbi:MAG: NAD-dependent epimerase/dehydratase family protein [Armatimonadetes bacterium]|nr:NAD-dependent epimerase/dehydratase family protein [Armatimonadota bacterium]MDE2207687.1 NAD-dependent epimerase/dehydratase family protein [Armatimonadota bacterium]
MSSGEADTALVTGVTGFLGFHVAQLLLERPGVQVRALARASSNRAHLDLLACDRFQPVIGDLNDRDSLRKALSGCRRLYHVAADYRLWSRDPRELYRSNVDGTRNVLQAAADCGVERVVYTSTVGALGRTKNGSPADEDTPVSLEDMTGHYKRSKYLAEEVAREYAERGLNVVITNPSTPVGEHDIKPTPTGRIILDLLNGGMPAFVDTWLNLIDVRDAARGTLLAGDRGAAGRRYILGAENVSLAEMLRMVAVAAGRKPPRIRLPWRVAWAAVGAENLLVAGLLRREPRHPLEGVQMARKPMVFDNTRAVRELGLECAPVSSAMARAVSWFRENGMARG